MKRLFASTAWDETTASREFRRYYDGNYSRCQPVRTIHILPWVSGLLHGPRASIADCKNNPDPIDAIDPFAAIS